MSHDTPVSAPRLPTPPGACDTHLHIYEPGYEMRASASHPSQPGTLAHYRELQKRLGLERAVIVQPSGYGTDNACTLEAMAKLGDAARGVAIVDPAAPDAEIERLTKRGIRGIRYHIYGSKSGPPRYEDKARIAKELIRAAPERMVWATNWPHPSIKKSFPDEGGLLDLVADWTQDESLRRKILVSNAARLYGFES